MTDYEFRQCRSTACRFRFPYQGRNSATFRCPVCDSPTALVGHPVAGMTTAVAPLLAHPHPLAVMLDNIRSIHNVGSIFRTADGAGVAHLYLAGITATPENPKLVKAALGAQEKVPWSYSRNGLDTAVALKQQGFQLWAIEATPQAQSLFATDDFPFAQPVVLVLGNERAGVDPGILDICDHHFSLPMGGMKRSLNVAVAFGIAVYYLHFAERLPPKN